MDFESSFKSHLERHFLKASSPSQKILRKAVFYSLLGKASRFRPKLCFATAKALGKKPEKILLGRSLWKCFTVQVLFMMIYLRWMMQKQEEEKSVITWFLERIWLFSAGNLSFC